MARARNIKPSFFLHEGLGTRDPLLSLLFAGLWCLADRDGLLQDRPLRIKAELFPYRESLDINRYLTVLSQLGLIRRFAVGEGRYIHIPKFAKHQHPHHTEKKSELPNPDKTQGVVFYHDLEEYRELTVKPPLDNRGAPSDLLIPDSGFTDSLIPDSLVLNPEGNTPASDEAALSTPPAKPNPPPTHRVTDPIFEPCLTLLTSKGAGADRARAFLSLMRKGYGDELVLEVFRDAERDDVTDPVAWVKAALDRRKASKPTKQQSLEQRNQRVADGWRPPELREAGNAG